MSLIQTYSNWQLFDALLSDYGRRLNVWIGRGPEVAHAAASRVEQTFACQLTGDQQLPLLADSTYSTSLPDSYRCVYWMAGLETESHQALPGHKRPVGFALKLSFERLLS